MDGSPVLDWATTCEKRRCSIPDSCADQSYQTMQAMVNNNITKKRAMTGTCSLVDRYPPHQQDQGF